MLVVRSAVYHGMGHMTKRKGRHVAASGSSAKARQPETSATRGSQWDVLLLNTFGFGDQ